MLSGQQQLQPLKMFCLQVIIQVFYIGKMTNSLALFEDFPEEAGREKHRPTLLWMHKGLKYHSQIIVKSLQCFLFFFPVN